MTKNSVIYRFEKKLRLLKLVFGLKQFHSVCSSFHHKLHKINENKNKPGLYYFNPNETSKPQDTAS